MPKTLNKQQLVAPFGLFCTAAAIYAVCLCACGSSSPSTTSGNAQSGGNTASSGTTGASGPTGAANTTMYGLTITNQLSWCQVTASINGNQVANFNDTMATVQATAQTTVDLSATPLPGFSPPMWTNTTDNANPNTTYVMTTDPNQAVNVSCE